MTHQYVLRTNQSPQNDKPDSSILQRTAVREAAAKKAPQVQTESPAFGEPRLKLDLMQIPVSNQDRPVVQPKLMVGSPRDRNPVWQLKEHQQNDPGQAGLDKQNNTGGPLPDRIKAGVENLSGMSMDDVRVYYNSSKPAQLNALAYTQGTDIHVGPGQERHIPHEAWHVVQQKQGRVQPTMHGLGVAINDDRALEKEADVMGLNASREGSINTQRSSKLIGNIRPLGQKTAQLQQDSEASLPSPETDSTDLSTSLDPASAPIEAVLAESPAGGARSPEQKKSDLSAAQTIAKRIIKLSESVREVEAWFPALKQRFGLKSIAWHNLGEGDASLDLEINPKAQIKDVGGQLELNEGDKTHLPGSSLKQDVKFTKGKIDGTYDVGVKMIAEKLGPNHPQGDAPSQGALKDLMKNLPTDPKQPGENKYIKGHLLNDNLGGPGETANLYPITGQANHDHETEVEHSVKDWVNNQGYWVYYEVEVKKTASKLTDADPSNNYVNAKLECKAQKLDAAGDPTSKGAINKTIESKYKNKVAATDGPKLRATSGTDKPEKAKGFDKNKVELSKAQAPASEPEPMDTDVNDAVKKISDYGISDMPRVLEPLFPSGSQIAYNMLADSNLTFDKARTNLLPSGDISRAVGVWNESMYRVNKDPQKVIERLEALAEELKPIKGELEKRAGRSTKIKGAIEEVIKDPKYKPYPLPKRK